MSRRLAPQPGRAGPDIVLDVSFDVARALGGASATDMSSRYFTWITAVLSFGNMFEVKECGGPFWGSIDEALRNTRGPSESGMPLYDFHRSRF